MAGGPTYDGEYRKDEEVVLPAVASGRFFVNFQIESGWKDRDSAGCLVRCRHSRGIDVQCQLNWRCSQTFWIRNGGQNDNEQLAVVVLRQERGAVCQLLDTQSEVGGLVFRFGTNGQVPIAVYPAAGRKKEVEDADRNRSELLSDGRRII